MSGCEGLDTRGISTEAVCDVRGNPDIEGKRETGVAPEEDRDKPFHI